MKTILAVAATLLLATAAHAQERSAGQNYDAQTNWSALKASIDSLRSQNTAIVSTVDTVNTGMDHSAECAKKGELWDGTACVMARTDVKVTCRLAGGRGAKPGYVSVAKCAPGEFVTGGGGMANQPGSKVCDSKAAAFIHATVPDGSGWAVDAYKADISGDACTVAYAICCKVIN